MSTASDNLRNHQEQADMDGTMVKVSRQAVEETLAENDFMLEALYDAAFAFGTLGVLFEPGNPARDAMQKAKDRVNAAIAKATNA